ncbi:sugar nucleotide-binding protein [Micromonospora sp. NPDC092111]|uniref:sugar nucleotide-binding protein n=1 Tax=Micromonospora sp. NPDC092111 TaxID=3364289 RepID=UPI00381E02C3
MIIVVGRGLIGGAVCHELRERGQAPVTVARSAPARAPGPPPSDSTHLRHDLDLPAGQAALRADLERIGPRRIVLTHGPSDVSWMEENEERAARIHCGVARLAADSGVPTLLISTDNVFSGERGLMRPTDPVTPHNAYGRLKAEAERIVLAGGGRVLRVSLVYGHADAGYRATYAQRCLAAAAAGAPFPAPVDQSFTPIHIDDVARVVAARLTMPAGAGPVAGAGAVAHLAGPQELSRYEFARLAYAAAGADPELVRPCLRRDTPWASRPRYSSLACTDFRPLLPGHWPPATPAAGLRRMVSATAGAAAP